MASSRVVNISAVRRLTDKLKRIASSEQVYGPLVIVQPQLQPKAHKGKRSNGERQPNAVAAVPAIEVRGARGAAAQDAGGTSLYQHEHEDRWPTGPVVNNRAFGAENTAQLVAALIPAAQSNARRLTIALLRETMKHIGFDGATTGRYALPIFVWFLKAGVLTDTGEPRENRPYALARTDHAEIREALRATAPPEPEEIIRAKDVGLK